MLSAVRGHHERFDGTGYPDGLRGDQIPLLARLISIPDCFDALTTSRAWRYRAGRCPSPRALAIIRAGRRDAVRAGVGARLSAGRAKTAGRRFPLRA